MNHATLYSFGLAVCLAAPSLVGQITFQWPSELRAVSSDSGQRANTSSAAAVVYRDVVHYADTHWMQLQFDEAATQLPTGSRLKLTAVRDNAVQWFDADSLREWSYMSAYFNGDTVLVELIAAPGTASNRVLVVAAERGTEYFGEDTICGPTDNRAQSNDVRQGRLGGGCTGWLIDSGLALTAGHCTGSSTIIEFNVPNSTAGGQRVTAAPNDQYPYQFVDRINAGVGSDWGVGVMGANSNTGLTPVQANGGQFYTLAPSIPQSATIRITGYGSSSSVPTLNLVQKTHTGSLSTVNPTSLCYATDTTGGNSGSPVVDDTTGFAVGIHTHGGCSSTGGCNSGTRIDRADLQTAIANLSRVVGSFTPFGAGCVGTGQSPSGVCQSANDTGPDNAIRMRDNVGYALELTASQNLNVDSFEIYCATRSGAAETLTGGVYLPDASGTPSVQVATATMNVGATEGWVTATLNAPLALPAGTDFFVFFQCGATGISLFQQQNGTDVSYYRLTGGTWGARVSGRFNWSVRANCVGTNAAVPLHAAASEPRVGRTLSSNLAAAAPGAPAFLILGFSNASAGGAPLPLPLDAIGATGCSLLVSTETSRMTTTTAAGTASLNTPLPNDPSFIGQSLYTQYAVVDAGANALGLVLSNAGTVFIGE